MQQIICCKKVWKYKFAKPTDINHSLDEQDWIHSNTDNVMHEQYPIQQVRTRPMKSDIVNKFQENTFLNPIDAHKHSKTT